MKKKKSSYKPSDRFGNSMINEIKSHHFVVCFLKRNGVSTKNCDFKPMWI